MQSFLQLHKSFKNHGVYCLSLLQDLRACLKCRTSNMFLLHTCKALYWPISSVAKPTLSAREVWASIPGPIRSSESRQRLAIVATFVRNCVTQALSRGDGPRHSLHASVYYCEYNEDLIFCVALSLCTRTTLRIIVLLMFTHRLCYFRHLDLGWIRSNVCVSY